ncbi:hypothetical protein [Halalkalibacillus sediminis]|nr:hypothetical protein [Halalkalibacillus sediminis]
MKSFLSITTFIISFYFFSSFFYSVLADIFTEPIGMARFIVIFFGFIISIIISGTFYRFLEDRERTWFPPKRRLLVTAGIIFFLVAVFGIDYWNDYREKPVLAAMKVNVESDSPFYLLIDRNEERLKLTSEKDIKQFFSYFEEVTVQRVKEDEWQLGKAYSLHLYNEKNGHRSFIISNGFIMIGESLYEVIDGDWNPMGVMKFLEEKT